MSLAYEDWKRFELLSGRLSFGDATSDEREVFNAEAGGWTAMCDRDEDHRIAYIVAVRDDMLQNMRGGVLQCDEHMTVEHVGLDSESGVILVFDRKLEGKLPPSFSIPEHKLNGEIVEAYGKPDDPGKDDSDRFVESCFHLAYDSIARMPELESMGFGLVCQMDGGADVSLLVNDMRDVVGFEMQRRRG